MDGQLIALAALRWLHVTAAILWTGMAYFLNFALAPAAAAADAASKRQWLPGVMARAVFWIRWSALATFLSGWAYIFYKCGTAGVPFHGKDGLGNTVWGQWVSIGSILGSLLFLNVWLVIVPAQKKVISWMRSGENPGGLAQEAARGALASRINAYLSAPLIFIMLAASHLPLINLWIVVGAFVAGGAFVAHLFLISRRAGSVAAVIAVVLLWPATGQAAEKAKALYQQHCARCHGDAGYGDGPAHTMQRPWPRDFTTGVYKFKSTPAGTLPSVGDVERVIARGIPRTSMPGYQKWLTSDEMRQVAEYVLSLSTASGRPDGTAQAVRVPEALSGSERKNGSWPADRLARGKAAFAVNCASCHGADGRGLGELAGRMKDKDGFLINPVDLTDALAYGGGATAAEIYKTLTVGVEGSPMTAFDPALDDTTRADVAAYVESLQVEPARRTLVSREDWDRALPSRERGEYLVRAMSCALCHNSYDASGAYYVKPYLAGGVAITLPGTGTFPTRNITSHNEDGLGRWTEEEIVRVITTGHAPDRRIEAFSMPWVYFSHLTEGDARDVAAYVKSLKPFENRIPPRRYDPIWKRLWTRLRQLVRLEPGRLEYPPFNVGSRPSQAEKLDAERERAERAEPAERAGER